MAKKKAENEPQAPAAVVIGELRKLAPIYKAMETVVGFLVQIGSLENHIAELEARRDELLAEEAAIQQSALDAIDGAKEAERLAAEETAFQQSQANGIIESAEKKAVEIVRVAMDKARAAYYSGTDAEREEFSRLVADKARAQEDLSRAWDQLTNLEDQIAARAEEHETVEKKFNDLKAQVASMIS